MQGGRRAKAGRKPVEIDLVELEKLCSFQCTHEERRGALVRYGPLRRIRRRLELTPRWACGSSSNSWFNAMSRRSC
jgi:hypothetical protein